MPLLQRHEAFDGCASADAAACASASASASTQASASAQASTQAIALAPDPTLVRSASARRGRAHVRAGDIWQVRQPRDQPRRM